MNQELLDELKRSDTIIVALWAMLQHANIPDSAEWPTLHEVRRRAAIAKAEGHD